jgi:hypothetical protein
MWTAIIGTVAVVMGTLYGADLTEISKPVKKGFKKAIISTLIYGTNIPQNSEVAFQYPYLMKNDSKLPIFNITLQLQYASKHAIKNGEKIIGMGHVVELTCSPEAYKYREVQIRDSMAEVRYTIPVLRPGEKIVIPDIMKFSKLNHSEELDNGDYAVNKGLARKLREIKKLSDFCVVDVFVYSESCPPLSRRTKVLWIDTNSTKELESVVNDTIEVLWGGKLPKPGIYFCFRPWNNFPLNRKKIFVEEYGEATIPKLDVVKTSKDRYFCWENSLESEERNIFILNMPPWNYYQLSGNHDTDDLLMRSGFQRVINEEQMGKWRNIFKGLRK